MSAHRLAVVLSPFAEADFEDILVYKRGKWGDHQADSYAATLGAALSELATHPEIGRPREDLQSGLRSYLIQRQHYVIYRIETDMTPFCGSLTCEPTRRRGS
jgi:plasmid stabilization system protein ParE